MGPFHTAEIAMMVIVTVQVLVIAYLQSPRVKSMVYMLPIPFSTALVTTGRGIDATHLVGMAASPLSTRLALPRDRCYSLTCKTITGATS